MVAVGNIVTEADLLAVVDALDAQELDRLGFQMGAALEFVRSLCRIARGQHTRARVVLDGDVEAVRGAGALLCRQVELAEVSDG